MYFNRSTILSLVSLLPALSLQAAVIPRQSGVYCQTSSASPDTADITLVINQLKGEGPDAICGQNNGHASDCTTLVTKNSAGISICGGTEDTSKCMDIANYANDIQQECLSNGKAGGQYQISASLRVEVIGN
ncbi:hypothetical protein MMC21_007891 [Puttea exsequens]|nr:hypothetical protein [Puttea exsequens]